jgi:ankyrin repeat protein
LVWFGYNHNHLTSLAGTALVQLLLDEGAGVNAKSGSPVSPLGAAAYSNNESMVQLLLDAGADVNARSSAYGCPLALAAHQGSESAMRLLLDAGADINAEAGRYGCPLGAATSVGEEGAVRLLLNAGADINNSGGAYGCPLGTAAWWHQDSVVRLLLDAGADVNAEGGRFGYPLGAAASVNNYIESVRLLLDSGADIDRYGGSCSLDLLSTTAQRHGVIARLQLKTTCDAVENGGLLNTVLSCAALTEEGFSSELTQLLVKTWASLPPCPRAQRVIAPLYTEEYDWRRLTDSDEVDFYGEVEEENRRRRRSI